MEIVNIMEKLCDVLYEKHFKHVIKESEWEFGSTFTRFQGETSEVFYMGSRYEADILRGENLRTNHFLLKIQKLRGNEGVYTLSMTSNSVVFNHKEVSNTIISYLLQEEHCDLILDSRFTGQKAKKLKEMQELLVNQDFFSKVNAMHEFRILHTDNNFKYRLNVEKETMTILWNSTIILETGDIKELEKWCLQEKTIYEKLKSLPAVYLDTLSNILKSPTRLKLSNNGLFPLAGKLYPFKLHRKVVKNGCKHHLKLSSGNYTEADLATIETIILADAEKLGKSVRLKNLFK